MIEIIKEFMGEYRWLSNFHEAPVSFEGMEFPSTENAYQAAKTLCKEQRRAFQTVRPNKSKRMGRKLEIRPDWEEIKISVMLEVTREKYLRHKELREKLLATKGKYLIEGNTWNDTFWGVCRGEGRNELGKILMQVRNELSNI